MIHDIGVIFVCVGILCVLFRFLKQPIVPAYILAGIIVGPLALGLIDGVEAIKALSEMAFAVMLFVIGIEMDLDRLEKVGAVAILGGIAQVAITFLVGWGFGFALGLNGLTSSYIGLILAFSSTMLVVKILGDSRDLDTLHGRVAVGILIMQDILAIFALAILSTGTFCFSKILSTVTLTSGLILLIVLIGGKYVMPKLFGYVAKDRETLFCFSLASLFIIGFWAESLHLTLGIGAFLVGLGLSSVAYRFEVIGDMKALKSFFAVLFFASLGLQMVPSSILVSGSSTLATLTAFSHEIMKQIWLIGGLVFLAMVVKPLICAIVIVFFGYERSTACHVGISLGQLSEFGMVLAIFGVAHGSLGGSVLMAVIIATTITILLSTYLIEYVHALASRLVKYTGWLNRLAWLKQSPYNFEPASATNNFQVVIVGHDKLGRLIAQALRKHGISYMVVDSNPEVIRDLASRGVPYVFGDVTCPEVLERINFGKVKTVFSSLPDMRDNSLLLEHLNQSSSGANFISIVNSCKKARLLYDLGVHYVLITYVLAADHLEANQTSHDLKALLGITQEDLKLMGQAHHQELCGECKI